MADDTPTQPGPGQAVPQPTPVVKPQPAPQPTASELSDDDKRAKAADLRRQAAEIEASLERGPSTVNVKVEPPHSSISFGGLDVGNDFVPVPASRLADLQGAAANAGVELTTEG